MMNVQTQAARNSDPVSSHFASDDLNQSGRRGEQVRFVASLLKTAYRNGIIARRRGITSKELSHLFDVDRYLVARRLPDAAFAGLAIQGDKEHTRKCDISERQCIEWWPSRAAMDEVDGVATV